MQTSFLIKGVDGSLIYVQSQMKKPLRNEFPSVYQYDRAFGEFNGTQKFYSVKEEDKIAILEMYSPENLKSLESENGLNVPYENMEVYTDKYDGKKYAKASAVKIPTQETVQVSTVVANTSAPIVYYRGEPIVNNAKAMETNRLFFEIQVDEADGEPLLQFTYDGKVDTMEEKILKSFVIKALKSGINIENLKNNCYQIKIGTK